MLCPVLVESACKKISLKTDVKILLLLPFFVLAVLLPVQFDDAPILALLLLKFGKVSYIVIYWQNNDDESDSL